MPVNDEVRAALNAAMESSQKGVGSSDPLRPGPNRRATRRSGLSGGVGLVRSTRLSTNVSPNSDLGTVGGPIASPHFSQ